MMKKLFNILLLLTLVFTYSCDGDLIGAIYEPANNMAEFSSSNITYKIPSKESSAYSITITRSNTAGSAEIAINTESDANIFTIPAKVTFEDGKKEAVIPVSINYDAMEIGKEYSVTINLPKQEIKEKIVSTVLTVSKDYTWKSVATGNFTSTVFEFSAPTELMQATEDESIYKLVAPFAEDYDLEFKVNEDKTISLTSGLNNVGFYDFQLGINYGSYGPVYAYIDPNSTFDLENKTLSLNMTYYVSAGYLNDEDTETFTW